MPGLLRGVARTAAVVGTATAVSNRVSRRQAGRWAQQDAPQEAAPQAARTQPTPADTTDSTIAELTSLGDLRKQGVLTEAEFETQKARILA